MPSNPARLSSNITALHHVTRYALSWRQSKHHLKWRRGSSPLTSVSCAVRGSSGDEGMWMSRSATSPTRGRQVRNGVTNRHDTTTYCCGTAAAQRVSARCDHFASSNASTMLT